MNSTIISDKINAVRRRESFGGTSPVSGAGALNIAFGIDENYARFMGVLISSIVAQNPDLPLIFHVFTDSIRPADHERIVRLTKIHPISLHIYYINTEAVKNLPASSHYSTAVYYRILMPAILQGVADRVLYLDSDMICIGNMADIANLDMGDHAVAAVTDVQQIAAEKILELHLQHGFYFNSGVMLIDVEKWNAADFSAKVLKVLSENKGRFSLLDQDALNLVLDGSVSPLSGVWNQVYDLGQMTHDPIPGTIFLHYTGAVKPWRLAGRHRLSAHYQKHEAQSPWSDSPLLPPANYKEMEIYARLSLKAGDISTALRWYGKYIRTKFLR